MDSNLKMSAGPEKENRDFAEWKDRALVKQVEELESALHERTTALKHMERQLKAAETSDANSRAAIETFTKQAKETYRKYEEYLTQAEDSVRFFRMVIAASWELAEKLIDAATIGASFSVKDFWAQSLNKTEAFNSEKALERLAKSSNLAKKNLFKEANVQYSLAKIVQPLALQAKLDGLTGLLANRSVQQAGTSSETQSESPSLMAPRLVEDPKAAEPQFGNVAKALSFARDTLAGLEDPRGVAEETLRLLLTRSVELSDEMVKLCHRAGEVEPGEDLSLAREKVDRLLKDDLVRLGELKDKNAQARVLNQHIITLSQENEELFKRMQISELSLLEKNSAILALEKSVRRIETAYNEKESQLEALRDKAIALNGEAAEAMRRLLDAEEELGRLRCAEKDLQEGLESSAEILAEKKEQLARLRLKVERSKSEFDRLNDAIDQEEIRINELVEDLETQAEEQVDKEERRHTAEQKLREQIRKQVRGELDRLVEVAPL